jgi:hypothetical protein
MACKGRCEDDVRALIAMIEINLALSAKAPRQMRANRLAYSFVGWFLTGAGMLFVALGMLKYPAAEFLLIMGGFMVFFGLICTIIVSRMPRYDARKTDAPSQGGEAGEESS